MLRFFFPALAGERPSTYSLAKMRDRVGELFTMADKDSAVSKFQQSIVAVDALPEFYTKHGAEKHTAVCGVGKYAEAFDDIQPLQLRAALRYGVGALPNRTHSAQQHPDLVAIDTNPYYEVQELTQSVPYLVPRAALLLQDIARNFMDSLYMKRLPMHKIVVTSVLRTKEDVKALQRSNRNATTNSCHLYGTTFDISYIKFRPIDGDLATAHLKPVLAEVLSDLRRKGRCYVKYERHQPCFHITVR